ncbi:hypothetical protein MMC14_000296 [Varicellaria rhodocarpa]|nr:hypothetical protein [Varicellaria rhodocarpa]
MGGCDCGLDGESPGSVNANPDVASLGVLISFLFAAFVTFLAIIIGYFSDSIAPSKLNRADWLVVDTVRRHLRRHPIDCIINSHKDVEARNRRSETLEKFVLAQSDQQLITGIAILIAGYINPCSMDLYHFQIDYLILNPVLRACRIVGMILTLVGLFVAQVITFGYEDSSLLAVCSLRHGIDAIKYSGRFFVLQYILGFISVILYLIISYGNKAVRLSSGHSDSDLINWITRKKSDREKWKNRTAASHFNSTHRTRTSLAYEREARRKIRERNRDVTLGKRLSQGCSIKNFFTSMKFVSQELSDSFLIEILWLAFGNLYGLLGIIRSRVMNAPEIVGSENQMGFGQIVPLLLTVLPLLAAAEAYHEILPSRPTSNSAHEPLPKHSAETDGVFSPRFMETVEFEDITTHDRNDPESGFRSHGDPSNKKKPRNAIKAENSSP